MLSCKEASALLSQGQERRLTAGERLGVRFHLFLCAGCRRFDRQLAVLRAACGAWKGRT